MSICIPSETKDVLGGPRIPKNKSRSLFLNRFTDPDSKESERKQWFENLAQTPSESLGFRFKWLPRGGEVIFARLMSRLMINMSGGVMENANLLLDRFGLPIIPGSAVKGCARRMALQALRDWNEFDGSNLPDEDVCSLSCRPFQSPSEMLAGIASVFGWIATDWDLTKKDGYWTSDFCWACMGNQNILDDAKLMAGNHESFSGTIAFVQASPHRDPGLIVDVVTPHHTAYHNNEKNYQTAPDTEDPIPNYFPAVKEQGDSEFFIFPLIPLSLADENALEYAALWLRQGLELLGLGAKTAAGYGWFDASDEIQTTAADTLLKERERLLNQIQKQKDLEEKRIESELKAKEKEEDEAALSNLSSPEEKEDYKIAKLTDVQFEGKIRNFCKRKGAPSDAEKAAIVRSLRGNRLDYWQTFKQKSNKGKLARIQKAIHTLNKQLHGDKMP